jgi:hypothetical protein
MTYPRDNLWEELSPEQRRAMIADVKAQGTLSTAGYVIETLSRVVGFKELRNEVARLEHELRVAIERGDKADPAVLEFVGKALENETARADRISQRYADAIQERDAYQRANTSLRESLERARAKSHDLRVQLRDYKAQDERDHTLRAECEGLRHRAKEAEKRVETLKATAPFVGTPAPQGVDSVPMVRMTPEQRDRLWNAFNAFHAQAAPSPLATALHLIANAVAPKSST